jgi:anti-anti-sigma factor
MSVRPTRIEWDLRESGGGAVLALAGELDIAAVADVEPVLERLQYDGMTPIVLDLRRLEFLDSSGLRLVLAADARARRDGRRLVLVRGPESIHRVFELALLDHRLRFTDHPDDPPTAA